MGNTANKVDKFDGGGSVSTDPMGTPQKSANRKKLKGEDGEAIANNPTVVSAASLAEDHQEQ